MTERPVLFTGPMVRALLAGTKTQTRRVRGLDVVDPDEWSDTGHGPVRYHGAAIGGWFWRPHGADEKRLVVRCPYGAVGDKLWVRERTRCIEEVPRSSRNVPHEILVRYEADGAVAKVEVPERIKPPEAGACLFMGCYREASRILLEITDVRVQRVQDISEEDAIAEGLKVCPPNGDRTCTAYVFPDSGYDRAGLCHSSADIAFGEGWREINGDESWDRNDWVWAISFRRVQP